MSIKSNELEHENNLPLNEIAYRFLRKNRKKIKITDLFSEICDILKYNESEYQSRLGDFFAVMCMDKRFIQLDKGFWDLRENHTIKIEKEEEEIEEIVNNDIIDVNESEIVTSEPLNETVDTEDDESDDDLKDLTIVDEEEISAMPS